MSDKSDTKDLQDEIISNIDINTFMKVKMRQFFASHSNEVPPRNVYELVVGEVERAIIAASLEFTDGNKTNAAQVLGIHRNTLQSKMLEKH